MRYLIVGVGLVAGLLSAGCGGGPGAADPARSGAAPGGDELRGRTFTTTEATEQGTVKPLVGTGLRLFFTDDGRLVANAGCNTISGEVDTAGGRLDAPGLSVTEMACAPELLAQDERFVAFFTAKPSWRLAGETLMLGSAGTELVLTEEKAAQLRNTLWRIDTLIDGEVAGGLPAGIDATLIFGADEVTVSGLCNLGSVPYRASDSTLTFRLGPMTLKACEPEIMTVEAAAVAVLDGEATYRIAGDTLTITNGGKGLRLIAA